MMKRKIDLSPLAQEYLLEAVLQAQSEIGALVADLRTSLANRDRLPGVHSRSGQSNEALDVPLRDKRKGKRDKAALSLLPSGTREALMAWAQRHDGKLIVQDFVNTNRARYNPNYIRAGIWAQVAAMRKQGIWKKVGAGRFALKAGAEKALAAAAADSATKEAS